MIIEMSGLKFGEWLRMTHCLEYSEFEEMFGKDLAEHLWRKFFANRHEVGKFVTELDTLHSGTLVEFLEKKYQKETKAYSGSLAPDWRTVKAFTLFHSKEEEEKRMRCVEEKYKKRGGKA